MDLEAAQKNLEDEMLKAIKNAYNHGFRHAKKAIFQEVSGYGWSFLKPILDFIEELEP
jgi:hypothetical protein